ncbi:MAG: DUF4166 domain-containing protein [Proteobacteria bacterium]|nr:DUF4166 domain-containing protein [Pseudomonadota bacterium]
MGRKAWFELPAAARHRFEVGAHAQAIRYPGAMQVRANLAGLLFAHVCRLIGTPLVTLTGENVPVTVEVYDDGKGAVVWDRTYRFPGRAPMQVSSRKVADRTGRLMEVVRGGLGMALRLSVEDHALHFCSTGYFLILGGLSLPIPTFLTPGHAHVIHTDLGQGRFRFTLSFIHPLWGQTIFQTGVFRDPKEA